MQYYNGVLCIEAKNYYHEYDGDRPGEGNVLKANYVTYRTYKEQQQTGKLKVVRAGKGKGNHALIDFDSIPAKYRDQICKDVKNPEREAIVRPLIDRVKTDYNAFTFFTDYIYPNGKRIPTDKVDNIKLWTNNSSIMNALAEQYAEHITQRTKQGKGPLNSLFFQNAATAIASEQLNNAYPHNLPRNPIRLKEKFFEYQKQSYAAFIKNLVDNSNAVKINTRILKLLSFIATMPTRPYFTKVVDVYEDFMEGRVDLVDYKSGEVFDRADYLDKEGNIIKFTEAAVWQRLNQPGLQVKIDKKRLGAKDFNDTHRPHHHRHSPFYSFSKITLDDRDLVWRDEVTKQRVKAYYAYDVASGCRIGSAYSLTKDETLFLDCLRDMFVFIDRHGFGMPLEVEVENHLVNKFFGDLEAMFPYLTICAPGNSQQKRAEHFNRIVKYQIEKNNHPGIGRWWLASKFNRVPLDRVGDDFKAKMKPADRLIVDDIQDSIEYNNSLHSDQKRYPGMTRMQVLIDNLNPALPKLNKSFITQYIGFSADTTINRSQYVKVQYAEYILPDPRVLELLKPNNREVTAYYIPDANGVINEVYLYQDGKYICTADRLETYNESKAERTGDDVAAKLKQDKYIAKFDKWVKDDVSEFANIEVLRKSPSFEMAPEVMPEVGRQAAVERERLTTDYAKKALDDFFN